MIKKFILRTICILFSLVAYSQSNQDISKINIDQMSDDQLQEYVQKAASSGMSQSQIEAAALAKGMKPADIQKLKLRIGQLNTSKSKNSSKKNTDTKRSAFEKEEYNEKESIEDSIRFELSEKEKKIFGYSLFNSKNLTFEPSVNIPTPQNYQLGVGDELSIDIWGASQANYRLVISPEGNINIDNVGMVAVNGLSIEKATAKIIGRLSTIYSGLMGPKPNTFAQVSLSNLRSIKVNLVGEVRLPGTYTLPSLASIFNALYLSGGPSINGSFRNVQLYRDNKLITTLDVYDFLIKGDQKNNLRLQDQDIILVKPFEARIELKGEIKTQAFFEVKNTDNVNDIIQFSGGFSGKAYTHRIKVERNSDKERQMLDVEKKDFSSFTFKNGDLVTVDTILDRFENLVEISGAVYRSGKFQLTEGLTLKQLIEKADGLRGDAFLSRAIIYRLNDDFTLSNVSVDLKLLKEGEIHDVALVKNDFVKIFSIFDLQEEYKVKIEGEVSKPREYPYVKDQSLEDIIAISGGFLESASNARIEVARRIKTMDATSKSAEIAQIFQFSVSKSLQISDSASKFKLMPFDQVYVRSSPGYKEQTSVRMKGEVMYPGLYALQKKDERISDLIQRSGGFTAEAYPRGASLMRKFEIDPKIRKKTLETLMENSEDSIMPTIDSISEQSIGIDLERIMKNPHSDLDLILQEGDELNIPKELQTVTVSGALLYPITVRYDRKFRFRKYISMAGGFADEAKSSSAFVVYANGKVDQTRSFLGLRFYPRIEPGAEIIVPRKSLERKMTTAEIVSLGVSVTTMSSTIVGIVVLINQMKQ